MAVRLGLEHTQPQLVASGTCAVIISHSLCLCALRGTRILIPTDKRAVERTHTGDPVIIGLVASSPPNRFKPSAASLMAELTMDPRGGAVIAETERRSNC